MSTARPGFPRFGGPFKTFSVSVSTNRESGTDSRLLVYSQGSRAVVSEYLWLKFLWDELSRKEMELFLLLPETLRSEIKISALRAVLLLGKRVVRERLIHFPAYLTEKDCPSRERYLGYKRLDVEIYDLTRSLPKVPKFSGWVRSSSSVGSKRSSRGPSFLEPLAIQENDYEDFKFDWYNYLTVGDEFLYPQWVIKVTLMRP
jgi:hypothetical protein